MSAVAPSLNIKMPTDPGDTIIESTVHLVGSMESSEFVIKVDMDIKVRGLEQEAIDKLVQEARNRGPYSWPTLGKVWTKFTTSTLE